MEVKGYGSVPMDWITRNGERVSVVLTNVLHVPGIITNLISVRKLDLKAFTGARMIRHYALLKPIKNGKNGRLKGCWGSLCCGTDCKEMPFYLGSCCFSRRRSFTTY